MSTSSVVITLVSAWILIDALILLFMYACGKGEKYNDDYWDED